MEKTDERDKRNAARLHKVGWTVDEISRTLNIPREEVVCYLDYYKQLEEQHKIFFNDLLSANDVNEIIKLFEKYCLHRIDKNEYPEIFFEIKSEEIEKLKNEGVITDKNSLNSLFSKSKTLTTLEKLLYSIIWKNGEIKKINHIISEIISGILGEKTSGTVFNQFGRYLNNKNELIIDENAMRAFIFFKEDKLFINIDEEHYNQHLNDYKLFVEDKILFRENKSLIDEILSSLGIKLKSIYFAAAK